MKMKDYKVVQYIYNKTQVHEDLIEDDFIYMDKEEDIIDYGAAYFSKDLTFLYYPAKSYSVAIIYSYLIHKTFNEDFYEVLNDVDLFCGNDKFYTPYTQSKKIYDAIIDKIGLFDNNFSLNMNLEQVYKTVGFFAEEFGVELK